MNSYLLKIALKKSKLYKELEEKEKDYAEYIRRSKAKHSRFDTPVAGRGALGVLGGLAAGGILTAATKSPLALAATPVAAIAGGYLAAKSKKNELRKDPRIRKIIDEFHVSRKKTQDYRDMLRAPDREDYKDLELFLKDRDIKMSDLPPVTRSRIRRAVRAVVSRDLELERESKRSQRDYHDQRRREIFERRYGLN